MDLSERLKKISFDFETGETPQEIVDTLSANIDRLIAEDAASNALQVGAKAPLDESVQWQDKTVRLRDFFTDQFLVLTWFRGNW